MKSLGGSRLEKLAPSLELLSCLFLEMVDRPISQSPDEWQEEEETREKYQKFVRELLSQAGVGSGSLKQITDEEGMKIFTQAITTKDKNPRKNYERMEFLGDGIAKGCISSFLYHTLPDEDDQGKLTNARINLESKRSFARFAEDLGFWEFVRATDEEREGKKTSILEDVFEAFIGAISLAVDRVNFLNEPTPKTGGMGFIVACRFLENILKDVRLDLRKAITMTLQEIYARYQWGVPEYIEPEPEQEVETLESGREKITKTYTAQVMWVDPDTNEKIVIGEGKSEGNKKKAKDDAARQAVNFLKRRKYWLQDI